MSWNLSSQQASSETKGLPDSNGAPELVPTLEDLESNVLSERTARVEKSIDELESFTVGLTAEKSADPGRHEEDLAILFDPLHAGKRRAHEGKGQGTLAPER